MLYYEFMVADKLYKLRLNTRNIVALEKQLGCNPLAVFGDGTTIPTVSTMVNILFYSLQQYQHNLSLNDAYDIFDTYLEDKGVTDFVQVILEIYKVSGIIRAEGAETEKN
jgi:hypothetical protein